MPGQPPAIVRTLRAIVPKGGVDTSKTPVKRVRKRLRDAAKAACSDYRTIHGVGFLASGYVFVYEEKGNKFFFSVRSPTKDELSGQTKRARKKATRKEVSIFRDLDPATKNLTDYEFAEQSVDLLPWSRMADTEACSPGMTWTVYDVPISRRMGLSPEELAHRIAVLHQDDHIQHCAIVAPKKLREGPDRRLITIGVGPRS